MVRKKSGDRKRQTKISFSPAAKSSPTTMGTTPSKNSAAAQASSSYATPSKPTESSSRKTSKKPIVQSSEDELAAEVHGGMSPGMPATSTEHGIFGSSDVDANDSESEEEGEQEVGYTKPKLASRKRRRALNSSEPEDRKGKAKVIVTRSKRTRRHSPEAELSDDELRLPRKRLTVTRRPATPESDDDDPKEEEEVEVTPPRSRRRKTARRQTVRRQSSPESEEDDEDEEETAPPRSSRHDRSRRQQNKDVQEESTISRSKRRRLTQRPATPSEDEDEEEDEEKKGEPENGVVSATEDEEEREDLQEDLAFLRSSPVADRGKLRSTHEKPKSERQKALEALKRRRAGPNEPSSSSATPGRSRRVVMEDSESDLEVIKEEIASDIEVISDPEDSRIYDEEDEDDDEPDRDANALDMFQEDNDDQGFIDDSDGLIGEPILNPDDFMPLVMARLTSAKPKELFEHAISWMVMKKIHPGFDAQSPIYDLVFRKLDDEVKGLANSKFSSSVWTADFTRALRARPDMVVSEIGRARKEVMDAYCEACNRKNHPASDEVSFMGRPYHGETLEVLDEDEDSDSDSDARNLSDLSADDEKDLNGEKPTYDASGARLPPESKTFTLGSTCKANAQVAHTLHHWRYHLYSWVKDYLAREGYLKAEKLVEREGWSDKKREKAARKIVKRMEGDGEIRRLYKLYKDQITYAVDARHDLRNGYRRG